MSKKPLIKDAVEYFYKNWNWDLVHEDKRTGLIIEKLQNVHCLRLCLMNHKVNEYVKYDFDKIVYFYPAKKLDDIHTTPCYPSLSYEEIRNLIRYHWEEEQ